MRKISYFAETVGSKLFRCGFELLCSKAYKYFRLEQKTMEKRSGLKVFSQTRASYRKVDGQGLCGVWCSSFERFEAENFASNHGRGFKWNLGKV